MEGPAARTVVLVAEDDPHARAGYLELLASSGYAVIGSGDGGEALHLALQSAPDIVVTDILLPGLDGFGMAGALRADRRTRHVPVLGMTGHWSPAIQHDAQRAGLSAVVLKPCVPGHLLAEIERVLRHVRLTSPALGPVTVGLEPACPVGLRNAVRRRGAY